MVVLLRKCGSAAVDGDLADAGVEVQGHGRGVRVGRTGDGAGQRLVEATTVGTADPDVAGEVHVGVDDRVDPARQGHVDLAGVEVHVDLTAVQRGDVPHAGQVEGDLAVGDRVDVLHCQGAVGRHVQRLAAGLPVGRGLHRTGGTQAEGGDDAEGDQSTGSTDEGADEQHH